MIKQNNELELGLAIGESTVYFGKRGWRRAQRGDKSPKKASFISEFNLENEVFFAIMNYGRILISVRRFLERPSSVSLPATGLVSP